MRKTILATTLILASTAVLASGEHGSENSAQVDRTISFEAGDMWFTPGERVSALITADAEGSWAFHCHLLYHMDAGMFRVVKVA